MKRISLFARDSRDMHEKRDGSEVSSSRVAPVAHVLLVSLTLHEQRFTRKSSRSAIAAEAFMNEAPRSKLRGILRNFPTRRPEPLGGMPKPLPSFAKATEGSPRLHPCSKLQGIRRRRIMRANPPEQLTEADLVLPNLEGVSPESIEPLVSANRLAEPSCHAPRR